MGMTNERGDLGSGVALVEVDASRIHDHRHTVDCADGGLEAMTGHRAGILGKALDVVVVDATHVLDETSQVSETGSEHDGDGMLD